MVTTSYETTDTVGGDLPVAVGGGHAAAGAASSTHADVFIDGLALNLHITPNTTAFGGSPYKRETADQTKPQFDTAPIAGEHTLSSYWIRSQMSLHGGAGIKFLDTSQLDLASQQAPAEFRYDTSRGIDVWTKGEVKRLPDTTLLAGTAGKTWCFATTIAGVSYLLYAYGATIKALQADTTTITYTVTGMTGTIKDICIDGANYYVATTDGHVFAGPIDNSAPAAAKWDFSSVSDVTLGWSKQRLMAGIDNAVYDLSGTGPALPTPTYTHPNASWRWSDFGESPNAIVAAGYAGAHSTIYSFTIDTSTGVPQLMPGIPIAQLPVGETVLSLYNYTGETLAIGTSVGLRIGIFQSFYGTFSYGSLTFPSRLEDAAPVTSISGRGSFIYAATTIDSEPSLIRVDLGTLTDQGIYAWAPDLRGPVATTGGSVTSVTCDAQLRLRFSVDNYGVVGEVPGSFTSRDAWLRTAKMRFNTVEPKHFKYGQIRSEGDSGTIAVSAQSDTTALEQVFTTDTSGASQRFQLTPGPCEWCQLTFDLTGDAVLTSYQILALPAGPRNRLITLPVQIFDQERNRHGMSISSPGRAKKILDALEAYESNGDELTLQVPCLGIDAVRVTVEKFTFTQTSNPTPNKKVDVGGYGTLVFRTTT